MTLNDHLKAFFIGTGIGIIIAIILIALDGCGHQPEVKKYDTNWTRSHFCEVESCPAFAKIHNYTFLLSSYAADEKACKCDLMSPNMPDKFTVTIPIDAPADSPVDSL